MKLTMVRRGALAVVVTAAIAVSGSTTAQAAEHHPVTAAQAAVARPVITAQPKSVVALASRTVTFSVSATGTGLTYRWQQRMPGHAWTDVAGATRNYHHVLTSAARNTSQYRIVIRNSAGQAVSSAAVLTVIVRPAVTAQPTARRAYAGQPATFSVRATGYGVTYRWQQRMPGHPWANIAGATKSYHNLVATPSRNGSQYRVVLNNAAGQAVSSSATLTVVTARPAISAQPSSKRVSAGQAATFAVTASGYGVSYRWQRLVGKTWTNVSGATHATHNVRASSSLNGTQFRVVVSNGGGQVISRAVTLGVQSTRSDPYRVGVTTALKAWSVRITESNNDGWADAKAQGFSPGPAAGNRYVIGYFDVRYLGAGSEYAWWSLDVEFVGSNGRTYTDTDKFFWNNDLLALGEMYHNATGSFVSVVEVPASAVAGGRWKITDNTDWEHPVTVWYGTN